MNDSENMNLEAVETTLEQIREESKQKRPGKVKRVFYYMFFPFVKLGQGIKWVTSRIPLSAKTTMLYTLLFSIAIIAINVFTILSVDNYLSGSDVSREEYVKTLTLTSTILIIISITLVASLGSLAAKYMLSPIRKIIKDVDGISGNDLSERLEEVKTRDELHELTVRINRMLDDIEQSFNRQKNFVSDAGHELKTPIAVIQGYSNLLLRWGKSDPEVLDESIESIAREAENMKRIVEQLLLLAKIGRYMLTLEEVDVKNELSGILDGYKLVDETHAFRLHCPKTVKCSLDKNLFTECVRAVVDNAVKYSEPNTEISVSVITAHDKVNISVIDSGRGISEADLPHIFDRFYRCDKARTRENNGSGLGLTIAKSIVEMMQGTLTVKSVLGVGSTFTFTFPIIGDKS